MKVIKKVALLLIIAVISRPDTIMAQDNNWELEKDKNDIKVFTRYVKDSDFKEFKGEMTVANEKSKIINILKDVAHYKEWVADCEKVELLKVEGSNQYHYVETSVPWPLKNRDMTYHFQYLKENNVETEVIITGKPNYIPEKNGIVRMEKANGFWKLTSLGDNRIKVTYQLHAEPSGKIPAWLANSTVVDMPYSTLLGLREILNSNN